MAKKLVIKLFLGEMTSKGLPKKQPITPNTLSEMDLNRLYFAREGLTSLNDKDVLQLNVTVPDGDEWLIKSTIADIGTMLRYIDKRINVLLSNPINFNRSLGWKY